MTTAAEILEFWFDFSCPYAYLASQAVEALAERTGAALELRPFLLGGVFRAVKTSQRLFAQLGPAKARHNARDMARWAQQMGLELKMPAGHPYRTVTALRTLLVTGEPYADLMHRYYRAYWVEHRDIGDPAVVADVLAAAGYDADGVLEAAGGEAVKQQLFDCTQKALDRGVFGAPALVVGGEQALYWGQDRFDQVERRLGGAPPSLPLASDYRGETAPVDFFFDFSSPFACLAAMRVDDVLGQAARWRPMLLGAVFKAVAQVNVPMQSLNARKRRWTIADMMRQAEEVGLPLKWPAHFPLRSVLPLRVTLLAGAHLDRERGHDFIRGLFRAYWAEGINIATPTAVASIADEHGYDGADLVLRAGEAKQMLFDSTSEAIEAGAFGAPTFVVHGPDSKRGLFWGADRLELATRAARGQFALL